jgi:hypothetical protein
MAVMSISGAGMTAKMRAAARARESRRPDLLSGDPLAQALAGEDGFRWMAEMRPPGAPAENPSICPRTWFSDDLVARAAVSDGFRQVVLLAADMDTRAFRLPLPAPSSASSTTRRWSPASRPSWIASTQRRAARAGRSPLTRPARSGPHRKQWRPAPAADRERP